MKRPTFIAIIFGAFMAVIAHCMTRQKYPAFCIAGGQVWKRFGHGTIIATGEVFGCTYQRLSDGQMRFVKNEMVLTERLSPHTTGPA